MKKPNLNSCNILQTGPESRQLWQFNVSGSQVKAAGQHTSLVTELVPPKAAAKSLLQRRLNIAWLPADQVFIRVVQVPKVEIAELISMIEFQLEKLSPFPVAQIVWSMELLPATKDGQQTVLVVIAARDAVEKFLGELETARYLTDQLELPQLHQLLTVSITGDGVWLFPSVQAGRTLCLAAWWFGGTLQQVQLIHLASDPAAVTTLVAQLNETAWAGELEGWCKAPTRVHLVAGPEIAEVWQAPLREWSGETVAVSPPLGAEALAELAARRAAQGLSRANLLPADFAVRYRQQFVDRVWMSGLGAVIAAYIVGVLIYFGVLYLMGWQKDKVVAQVKDISGSFTNTLRAKEKIEVLQTQLDLKFASLDTLQAVSDHLPPDFVLNSFLVSRGKTLTLSGTAPQGQEGSLNTYAAKLRTVEMEGRPVFKNVPTPGWNLRGNQVFWNLTCELKLSEN